MSNEKMYKDPEFGEIVLRKSLRSRRLCIRVRPGFRITVTLPFLMTYSAALRFFDTKREWVRKSILQLQAAAQNDSPYNPADIPWDAPPTTLTIPPQTPPQVTPHHHPLSPAELQTLRAAARAALSPALAALAAKYGFRYTRLALKNNRSNWGSCSSKGNINLNIHLMRLPQDLRDYVMLHELCHLRHMNHGREFHNLLETLCRDHLSEGHLVLRKRLKGYHLS